MNLQSFTKKFGVWLFISFIVLLIGIVQWDVKPYTAVLFAGLFGFLIFLRLDLHTEKGAKILKEIKSEDGTVTATIEDWTNEKSETFVAKVKRNYQDGVFAKEKEFLDLQEAKQWLTTTYQLELEKHAQHLREQQNH